MSVVATEDIEADIDEDEFANVDLSQIGTISNVDLYVNFFVL